MSKKKKKVYEQPRCPYCGEYFTQNYHMGVCYRVESFKLLEQIVRMLKDAEDNIS